jgi:hypothetical protein
LGRLLCKGRRQPGRGGHRLQHRLWHGPNRFSLHQLDPHARHDISDHDDYDLDLDDQHHSVDSELDHHVGDDDDCDDNNSADHDHHDDDCDDNNSADDNLDHWDNRNDDHLDVVHHHDHIHDAAYELDDHLDDDYVDDHNHRPVAVDHDHDYVDDHNHRPVAVAHNDNAAAADHDHNAGNDTRRQHLGNGGSRTGLLGGDGLDATSAQVSPVGSLETLLIRPLE